MQPLLLRMEIFEYSGSRSLRGFHSNLVVTYLGERHGTGDFQNRFIVSLCWVSVVSLKLKKSAMGYEWTKKLKWYNGSV
jgi:hypothetical protein